MTPKESLKLRCSDIFITICAVIISFTGCAYQSYDVLDSYFRHPSMVSTVVKKEAITTFPAVTVCLENWINYTNICLHNPKNCTQKDFTVLYSIPKLLFDRSLREQAFIDPKNFIRCRMRYIAEGCESFDCIDYVFRRYHKVPVQMCHTFDPAALPIDHAYFKCRTPYYYQLEFESFWDGKVTRKFMALDTLPVIVHEPGTNPPESMFSVALKPNQELDVAMTQSITQRLKKPYSTNCKDYKASGRSELFHGYMTNSLCQQQCEMDLDGEICGCVKYLNEYAHYYNVLPLCSWNTTSECMDNRTALAVDGVCLSKCQLSCDQVVYDLRMAGLQLLKRKEGSRIDRTSLRLYFASSSVEFLYYNPAWNTERLFAYLGGYLGVWTGASILGATEFLYKPLRGFMRLVQLP